MSATDSTFNERRVRVSERRRDRLYPAILQAEGKKVSWGGIFGGVLVAVGVLLLLAALGVAVGISAADPGQTDASTLGTGAGIWAALSLLLALFVGGMVSTRIGAISDRATGFFEGVLVWVVSILLMGYLAASGVSMLAGGAFKMLGGATQAFGAVAQSGGGMDMSGGVDQVLQRLRDPGTAQKIASATGMQASEVQATLNETAQRVESNRDNPTQAAAEAKNGMAQLMEKAKSSGALQQKAEEIQPQAAKGAWIAFGALLLSLIAAVLGAMSGRRDELELRTAG
ncbi:MAG TPA: hypothetical protein VNC62_09105 [Burkholderiales bacterium]|nr:hypothetical protein [Burkholderiales bacterium]